MNSEDYSEVQKGIDYIVDEVAKRGWDNNEFDTDEFSKLRSDKRFREALVASIYEWYFLPDRHEFEWHVISDIVQNVSSSSAIQFTGMSIAGGVIGNAAYDLIKSLFSYAADKFESSLGSKASERSKSFRQVASAAEALKKFFEKKKKARIEEIEEVTGLPREKIYPLIKLAGLKHHRRKNACYWEMPE